MNQKILKNYKKKFPFKLATTSYIIPDKIIPNVNFLSPFFDEIELLLFESPKENNIPEREEIDSLREISIQVGISYNIHLPIDVFLGDENKETRQRGVSMIKRVIRQTLPLEPSFYTLHLDLRDAYIEDIVPWKYRIIESLKGIMEMGVEAKRISIETLSYPFEWIEDILYKFNFSVCLDIGHILFYKKSLKDYLNRYLSRADILHLHGYKNGVDHLGIDRLSEGDLELIFSYLKEYKGIVSIEVFSLKELRKSLRVLEGKWVKN